MPPRRAAATKGENKRKLEDEAEHQVETGDVDIEVTIKSEDSSDSMEPSKVTALCTALLFSLMY